MKKLIVFLSGMAVCGAAQADLLASKGAKGTLSVQYEYSATGKKADKYEPAEWRVVRTINLVVPMRAEQPLPGPTLRPMDAEQTADLAKKQAHVKNLHTTMAPTMADMMKIAEKCDEDEACIEKAIRDYSKTMDMATIDSAKADAAAASKMGAPRYQIWQPVTQKGTYLIDESYRSQTSDPLCMSKPKQICSREETRKGGGDIPPPPGAKDTSAAMLEVDSQKKDVSHQAADSAERAHLLETVHFRSSGREERHVHRDPASHVWSAEVDHGDDSRRSAQRVGHAVLQGARASEARLER